MRYQLGALAACAAVTLAGPAAAQTAPPATRLIAHIDVAGQGSVNRMPDRGIVTFTIIANDNVASRATSAANDRYNALLAQLSPLGLSETAIKTTSYNVTFNQRPAQPDPQVNARYGFVAARSITVTTLKTDQVGAIIDAGVAAGVTTVDSSEFSLRDDREAFRAALAAAVADANGQATAMAAAAHLRIVRVLQLGTGAYAPLQPLVEARFKPQATADTYTVRATLVQPTDLTVNATVSVSYEVAPLP